MALTDEQRRQLDIVYDEWQEMIDTEVEAEVDLWTLMEMADLDMTGDDDEVEKLMYDVDDYTKVKGVRWQTPNM